MTNSARRRRTRTRTDAGSVVGQITQLVTANETLKRENAELLALNEQLRGQLAEIGTALGSLTNGSRRRGHRGAVQPFALVDAKPKRTRKPITDPEVSMDTTFSWWADACVGVSVDSPEDQARAASLHSGRLDFGLSVVRPVRSSCIVSSRRELLIP